MRRECEQMSLLTSLQTQCKERLEAQDFFSNASAPAPKPIAVYCEIQKDIISALNARLAKIGVGVLLMSVRLSNSSPAAGSFPKWDRVAMVARVIENVLINRSAGGTGQPADVIAEAVAYYLHSWAPAVTGYKLLCDEVAIADDQQALVYDVHIFSGGLSNIAPVRI